MLRSVKVPHVLLTHHFRVVDETTGVLMGALADVQAERVQELLREAGVSVDVPLVPDRRALDARHRARPLRRHALEWVATLDS